MPSTVSEVHRRWWLPVDYKSCVPCSIRPQCKGIEGQNEDLDANTVGRTGFGIRTLLFYTFGFLVIFKQNKNIWRLENTGNLLKQPSPWAVVHILLDFSYDYHFRRITLTAGKSEKQSRGCLHPKLPVQFYTLPTEECKHQHSQRTFDLSWLLSER